MSGLQHAKSVRQLSLKENMMWNAAGSSVYLLCQWLCTMLVVRLCPDLENAGLLSLAMSVGAIFYCVSAYNMRAFHVTDGQYKYADGVYLGARIALFGISLLACVGFSLVKGYSGKESGAIVIYMVFKISEALSDVIGGAAQRRERMDMEGKAFLLRGVLGTGAFGLTLYLTQNVTLAVLLMALVSFGVIFLYQMPRTGLLCDIRPLFSKKPIASLLLECFIPFLSSILYNSIVSVPRLFLEGYHGGETLAIYAAVAMPTLLVQTLCAYIFNPLLTRLTGLYQDDNRKGFLALCAKCVGMMVLVLIAGLLAARFLGAFGLGLLYGEKLMPYQYLLYLMVVNTALTAVVWFFSAVAIVLRRVKGLIAASALGMALCVAFSIWLIPSMGMDGASLAGVAAQACEVLVMGVYFVKVFGKRTGEKHD